MASLVDNLYLHSPIWLQQVAVALWGATWYRRRFNPLFRQQVQEFHERDYMPAQNFHEYQTGKLSQLFAIAWSSAYYYRLFAEFGVTKEMEPWEVMSRLPLLSKEIVRKQGRELLTKTTLPKGTQVFKSSGTTGTPTEIFFSKEFHALCMAVSEARNHNIGGANYRDRRVMFGVRKVCHFDQCRPPFWRISPVENMAYCSIYHLSPRFLFSYIDFLRGYRPAVIMGYPSALYTVAQFALENNILLPQAKMAVTTSETVTPEVREAIETVWQCRLYDRYGAVEGCIFAGQCEFGQYHISPDIGIVEILDAHGQPCPLGVLGEVVCTGLHNTLQPLIRYQIGDAARWAVNQQCACGRHTPIIEAIEGRTEDMCFTSDGRQVLRFDTVFKGVKSIKLAQVVQEKLGLFTVYVVPVQGFSRNDEDLIKHNMYLHVGDAQVHIEQVSEIKRGSSGKYRAVICKLPAEQKAVLRSTYRADKTFTSS